MLVASEPFAEICDAVFIDDVGTFVERVADRRRCSRFMDGKPRRRLLPRELLVPHGTSFR